MSNTKIAIIGAGAVGSTTAYALLLKDTAAEIILVDINEQRCRGEILDLADALPFCGASKIRSGTSADAQQADIIIIAAGARQKPDQERVELFNTNKAIIKSIFDEITPLAPHTIVIMVTNPLDALTYYAQQWTQLPRNQVFGTGTLLDTQRLRGILSKRLSIAEQSIHAYILAEHGDTQFPAWSCARIDGMPIDAFKKFTPKELALIAQETRDKAYEIISCKGATFYGIATCVVAICHAILFDQKVVMPLSTFIEELDVCLSLPVVLGKKGIEQRLPIELTQEEQEKLRLSAEHIRSIL